jgi:hypothetical protein
MIQQSLGLTAGSLTGNPAPSSSIEIQTWLDRSLPGSPRS